MGKLTISMAIFNSYVKLPEGNLFLEGSSVNPREFLSLPHFQTLYPVVFVATVNKTVDPKGAPLVEFPLKLAKFEKHLAC